MLLSKKGNGVCEVLGLDENFHSAIPKKPRLVLASLFVYYNGA
jgi:hypothetical protein